MNEDDTFIAYRLVCFEENAFAKLTSWNMANQISYSFREGLYKLSWTKTIP